MIPSQGHGDLGIIVLFVGQYLGEGAVYFLVLFTEVNQGHDERGLSGNMSIVYGTWILYVLFVLQGHVSAKSVFTCFQCLHP